MGETTRTRLDSLTGLRIFAALLVLGRHVSWMGTMDNTEGVVNFLSPGMVGVSFFYIVSGFVLAWTARPGDRTKQFYQRRFARIYPLYFVCWAVALGLLVTMKNEDFSVVELLPLTLLQSWVPNETAYFAVSAVFWSLSCEAFFYLVFPWILPYLQRLETRGRLILLAAIVAAVFSIAALIDPLVSGSVGHWFLYIFPPVRLLEFVLGILLALQMKKSTAFAFPLWAATLLTVASFFVSALAPGSYMRVAVTLIPFALLVWSAARADLLGLRSPFRWAPIVTLGVWSYAFYLIHSQVVFVVNAILDKAGVDIYNGSGVPIVFAILLSAAVSIGAAGILHKLVEAPMEKLLRPRRRGTGPVHDAVPEKVG